MQEIERTLDSREVAGMVKKDHSKLLRDIRAYIEYLIKAKIGFSDFFKESEYKDCTGRTLPCYRITFKGCEFIAHKMTGQKGTEFTARYINRFHEMESIIAGEKAEVAPVQPEQVQELAKEYADLRKEVDKLKADIYRVNRGIQMSYGSSYSYKSLIIEMLEGIKEEDDIIFLRQMYTFIKRHLERKNNYEKMA